MLCAKEELSIPPDVQVELYTLNLVANVKDEIENISPILEFMNELPSKGLVWATGKCLELQPSLLQFKEEYDSFKKKCLTPYGLLGQYLNPATNRQTLLLHMRTITELIFENHSDEVTKSFSLYKRNEDIFKRLKQKKLDYIDYWVNIKDFEEHAELATLALKIWNIPSSSVIKKMPSLDKGVANFEKLFTIYLWHAQ